MYPTMPAMLNDARFYGLLLKFDQDLVAQTRKAGCPTCGAALQAAPYPRKPRGGPTGLGPEHYAQLSLCCAAEGCRRRSKPPSLRFPGPKVYWGAVIVVISALSCGPTPARMRQLQRWVGLSRRTVMRWRRWWREVFVKTPLWRSAARVPPVAESQLPASLLERFSQLNPQDPLTLLLRFLSPLTTRDCAVSAM
jgi:hypothetical protein